MVTALLIAVVGGFLYSLAYLSSSIGEIQLSRTQALTYAKGKFSSGEELTEEEALLLLEDELHEDRNNRFRNF